MFTSRAVSTRGAASPFRETRTSTPSLSISSSRLFSRNGGPRRRHPSPLLLILRRVPAPRSDSCPVRNHKTRRPPRPTTTTTTTTQTTFKTTDPTYRPNRHYTTIHHDSPPPLPCTTLSLPAYPTPPPASQRRRRAHTPTHPLFISLSLSLTLSFSFARSLARSFSPSLFLQSLSSFPLSLSLRKTRP